LLAIVDPTSNKGKIFHNQCKKTIGEGYNQLTMTEIFEKIAPSLAYLNTFANIDITE